MKVFTLFGIAALLFSGIFTKTACGQVDVLQMKIAATFPITNH